MKYCTKCGAEVSDEAKFCPVCGFPMAVEETAQDVTQTVEQKVEQDFQNFELGAQKVEETVAYDAQPFTEPEFEKPVYDTVSQVAAPAAAAAVSPEQAAAAKSILVFGILGTAFACTVYLSILGIIFGAIARKKGKEYMAQYNYDKLSGKAKIGYILGRTGVILGIILAIVGVIAIVGSCTAALFNN